jgi:hypothetical protein
MLSAWVRTGLVVRHKYGVMRAESSAASQKEASPDVRRVPPPYPTGLNAAAGILYGLLFGGAVWLMGLIVGLLIW